jgi:hypothetical protein
MLNQVGCGMVAAAHDKSELQRGAPEGRGADGVDAMA